MIIAVLVTAPVPIRKTIICNWKIFDKEKKTFILIRRTLNIKSFFRWFIQVNENENVALEDTIILLVNLCCFSVFTYTILVKKSIFVLMYSFFAFPKNHNHYA